MSIRYNGDLSTPQGDTEDWISFKLYDPFVFASLECHGSDSLKLEIIENRYTVATYIQCNDPMKRVAVNPNVNYLVHLQAVSSAETLQYTTYILTIKTRP